LRGTGEGFAANVGGRMIGTSASVLTPAIAGLFTTGTPFQRLAYAAATTAAIVYAVGFITSFWLPEPAEEDAHD
jgi:hypothetical protein